MFTNNFKSLILTKNVDFSTDVFKAIVMQYGYIFDEDSHDTYADVVIYELPSGSGYTSGGITLLGATISTDTVNNKVIVSWNNIAITASGGDLGPIGGVILFDDTISGDPIAAYIDFNESYTIADGGTGTIANVQISM